MDRTRRDRVARVLGSVADQVPRAYAAHPRGVALPDAVSDPEWWRGGRFILPRSDAVDHWEATRMGDAFAYVEVVKAGVLLGLQVEGPEGVERLRHLLTAAQATRFEALVDAAARLPDEAGSAAVRVGLEEDGRWVEEVVDGREAPTAALGPRLMQGLLDAADDALAEEPAWGPQTAGVRLVRVPVDEEDPVALRRAAKRLVALWRPVWGVPVPRARRKKAELDAEVDAAYRRSLRFIAGRMGPAERARLRVEVRALVTDYREAGLRRPKLLDIVSERLGLL